MSKRTNERASDSKMNFRYTLHHYLEVIMAHQFSSFVLNNFLMMFLNGFKTSVLDFASQILVDFVVCSENDNENSNNSKRPTYFGTDKILLAPSAAQNNIIVDNTVQDEKKKNRTHSSCN